MWKRTNKSMVGVDIGSSSVKAVELQGKNGDFQLVSLGYEALEPDSVVDGQIMELNSVSNAISNIFKEHKIKTAKVAAGVNGHSVIVKNIVLPQMSPDELQESFAWHAEERSEEHTSELQSPCNLVCRLLLEKKKLYCVSLPASIASSPVHVYPA